MSRCNRQWEIDASRDGRLAEKDLDSLARHLCVCADCREVKSRAERLRALARALPDDAPSNLTMRRLRARVLRDVAVGVDVRNSGRWVHRLVFAVMVAACMAAVAASVRTGTSSSRTAPAPSAFAAPTSSSPALPTVGEPAFAGVVAAPRDARWTQRRDAGVERVNLEDGTITVHVRHQQPSERFLVTLPDGELEVRGTTFVVSVVGGATERVTVEEGLVELRLQGREVTRIGAGEHWAASDVPQASRRAVRRSPPVGALSVAPSVSPSAAAAIRAEAGRAVSVGAGDESAAAYGEAVEMLRAGRSDDAVAAFQRFALTYPNAPENEDASFLQAVALARAGRVDAAALAAEQHLVRFPKSFHRKEAAILIARAACKRGDVERANAALSPWAGEADVREIAEGCTKR